LKGGVGYGDVVYVAWRDVQLYILYTGPQPLSKILPYVPMESPPSDPSFIAEPYEPVPFSLLSPS
jgi:hypothetical protein